MTQLRWRLGLALVLLVGVSQVFSRERAFFAAGDPHVLLDVRDDVREYDDLASWPSAFGQFDNHGFVHCASGAFTEAG